MCCQLNKKTISAVGALSLLMITLGLALVISKESMLRSILESNLILVNSSAAYPGWQSSPVPIYTSIYFFNVTNAADVENKGARPRLAQMGPYVFQEFHDKTKLRWNDENNTVTYQQIRTYKYIPEKTNGSIDDVIVTLNAPAATVNGMSANLNQIEQGIIGVFLGGIKEKLFVARTVRELAFEGYKDPVLTWSSKLPSSWVPMKMDKFGYFYPRNGSDWYDGVFNMYTGKGDLSKLGQIHQWNYTNQWSFFPGKCGQVRGAGDLFSPGQNKTHIELFSNDLCRTLRFDYDYDSRTDGIRTYTYKASDRMFANKTENPENACYSPESEIPSGLFNASACRFGAPIFMSQPHFYQADPIYLKDIKSGLNPDRYHHETSFEVDPLTGVPIIVKARFQVNFLIQPISAMPLFKNIRKMYFPTSWFETQVRLTSNVTNELWLLSNLTNFCAVFGYIFIGAALATSAVVFAFFCTKNAGIRQNLSEQGILNESLFQENSSNEEEEQD